MFISVSLYNAFKSYILPVLISVALVLSPACDTEDKRIEDLKAQIKKDAEDLRRAEEEIRERTQKEQMAQKSLKEAETKLNDAKDKVKKAETALQDATNKAKINAQTATQQLQTAQAAQAAAQAQAAQSQQDLTKANADLAKAQAQALLDAMAIAAAQTQSQQDQQALNQAQQNLAQAQTQAVTDAALLAAAQAKSTQDQQDLTQAQKSLHDAQNKAKQDDLALKAAQAKAQQDLQALKKAHDDLKDTQDKAAKQALIDKQALADAQNKLSKAQDLAQQESKKYQQDIDKAQSELKNSQDKVASQEKQYKDDIEKANKAVQEAQNTAQQENKKYQKDIANAQNELKNAQEKSASQEKQFKEDIEKANKALLDAQNLAQQENKKYQKDIDKAQNELKEAQEKSASQEKQYKEDIEKANKALLDAQNLAQQESKKYQKDIDKAQNELKEAQEKSASQEKQYKEDIEKANKALLDAQNLAQQESKKYQKDIANAQDALKNAQEKSASQEKQYKENIEKANKALLEAQNLAQQESKKYQKDIANAQDELKNAQEKSASQEKQFKEDIEKANKALLDAQNLAQQEALKSQQEIAKIQKELKDAQDALLSKEKQNSDFIKQLAQVTQELAQKDKELQQVQADATQQSKKAAEEIAMLKKQEEAAQQELQKNQKKLADLDKHVQQNAKALQDEVTKNQKAEADLQNLNKMLQDLKDEAQKTTDELTKAKDTIKTATLEASKAETLINNLKSDVGEAKKDLAKAHQETQEAQQKLTQAQLDLGTAEFDKNEALDTVKELKAQLEKSNKETGLSKELLESEKKRADALMANIKTLNDLLDQLQLDKDKKFENDVKNLGTQQLQEKVKSILGSDDYMAYYRKIRASSGEVQAEQSIREIFLLEYKAKDNEAKKLDYCNKTFLELQKTANESKTILYYEKITARDYSIYFKKQASGAVIKQLISVCMSKSDYAQRYFATLAKIRDNAIKTVKTPASIEEVIKYLEELNKKGGSLADTKDRIWGTDDIELKNQKWMVISPQYDDPNRITLSKNPSQNYIDNWTRPIIKAENFVDLTTLPTPESGFFDALKQSIEELDKQDRAVTLRLLFGINSKLVQNVDVKDIIEKLTQDLRPETKLKIYVGTYGNANPVDGFSWNHSKIVAADGKLMFTGGHNPYAAYLDTKNPTHDLSLLIPGKLAETGHEFANTIWHYMTTPGKIWTPGDWYSFAAGGIKHLGEVPEFRRTKRSPKVVPLGKNESIVAVGRLGQAGYYETGTGKGNVSDEAIIKMMDDAQISLFISQQATLQLFFSTPFNQRVVQSLNNALLRGVDVYILSSSIKEEWVGAGNTGYSGRHNREQTWAYLFDAAIAAQIAPDKIAHALFKHLQVLPSANKLHEVPNHAKVVIADGNVAYVGSHNLYDDSHAEFGIIVGKLASEELVTDYFSPFWLASLQLGERLQQIISLSDYKIGDYVLIKRGQGDKATQNWTLGEVVNVSNGKVWVNLDLLRLFNKNMSRIREKTNEKDLIEVPGKENSKRDVKIPEDVLKETPFGKSTLDQ